MDLNNPDEHKIYRMTQLEDSLYGADTTSRGLCRRPYEQLFDVLFKNRGRSVCGACIPTATDAQPLDFVLGRKTCKCFKDSAGFQYVKQAWKCIPCFKKEVRLSRRDNGEACTICFSSADELAQEPTLTQIYTICRWCGHEMETV